MKKFNINDVVHKYGEGSNLFRIKDVVKSGDKELFTLFAINGSGTEKAYEDQMHIPEDDYALAKESLNKIAKEWDESHPDLSKVIRDSITMGLRLAATGLAKQKGKDLYLSVTRKTNHEDYGLPGGKIDPGETPEEAVVREVFEETGLNFSRIKPVFARQDGEFLAITYAGDVSGTLGTREDGVPAWVPAEVLCTKSSFAQYNTELLKVCRLP